MSRQLEFGLYLKGFKEVTGHTAVHEHASWLLRDLPGNGGRTDYNVPAVQNTSFVVPFQCQPASSTADRLLIQRTQTLQNAMPTSDPGLSALLRNALTSAQLSLKPHCFIAAQCASSASSLGGVGSSQDNSQASTCRMALHNATEAARKQQAVSALPTGVALQSMGASLPERFSKRDCPVNGSLPESDGVDEESEDLLDAEDQDVQVERHPRCDKPLLPGREKKREAQRRYRAGLRRTEQTLLVELRQLKHQYDTLKQEHQKLLTHEVTLHKLISVVDMHLETQKYCQAFKAGVIPSGFHCLKMPPQGDEAVGDGNMHNLPRLLDGLHAGGFGQVPMVIKEGLPQVLQRWYAAVQALAVCPQDSANQLSPPPTHSRADSEQACDMAWALLWVLAVARPSHFVMALAAGGTSNTASYVQLQAHWDTVLASVGCTTQQEEQLLEAINCFNDQVASLRTARAWLLEEMQISSGWESGMAQDPWLLSQRTCHTPNNVKYLELLKALTSNLAHEQTLLVVLYGFVIQLLSPRQLAVFVLKSRPMLPGVVELAAAVARRRGLDLPVPPAEVTPAT